MRLLMVDIVARFNEGETLAREVDLAAEFGVSRGVIRESLRGLEERGFIKIRHGSGTVVQSSRCWNVLDSDVLTVVLQSPERDAILTEFLVVRRLLEVEAAGLAAKRATPDHVALLHEALGCTRRAAERKTHSRAADELLHEADIEFHRCVCVAARNQVLLHLTESIQRAMLATRTRNLSDTFSIEQGVPEHKRIVHAIEKHDVAAAKEAMSSHLATVESAVHSAGLVDAYPTGTSP